jgi:PEP-CTERM motif-containing protein
MKRLPSIIALRCALAACSLLGALAASPSPANSLPTVFFDREDFGLGAGVGMTQATANNAAAAGIPIVQPVGAQSVLSAPEVIQSLDPSTLSIGATATITSNWTIANDTGTSLQDLYLVFLQPEPTIYLDGQAQPITYAAANVGIDLSGGNWVILAVELNSIPVYYPAVSLGSLVNGANAPFPLHYVLNNPQVFSEFFNYELGMPKWNLAFVTGTPIPEPSTACLVLLGLLAIASGRHKRS